MISSIVAFRGISEPTARVIRKFGNLVVTAGVSVFGVQYELTLIPGMSWSGYAGLNGLMLFALALVIIAAVFCAFSFYEACKARFW